MSKAEGAYEHASLPLPEYRVSRGRRVAWPLERLPRRHGLRVLVHELRIAQLSPRGHSFVPGVDEEDRHGWVRGYLGLGAGRLRRRPPRPGDEREDPARVRG